MVPMNGFGMISMALACSPCVALHYARQESFHNHMLFDAYQVGLNLHPHPPFPSQESGT